MQGPSCANTVSVALRTVPLAQHAQAVPFDVNLNNFCLLRSLHFLHRPEQPLIQRWQKHTPPQRKILISGNRCCISFYKDFVVYADDANVCFVGRALLFLVICLTSLSRPSRRVDGMLISDSWGIVIFIQWLFLRDCNFFTVFFLRGCDFVTMFISERMWFVYIVYFWKPVILQGLLNGHCKITVLIFERL